MCQPWSISYGFITEIETKEPAWYGKARVQPVSNKLKIPQHPESA